MAWIDVLEYEIELCEKKTQKIEKRNGTILPVCRTVTQTCQIHLGV